MNREIIERADHLLALIQADKAGPGDYGELLQLMEAHAEPWFVTHIQTYFNLYPKHIPDQLPSSHSPAWQEVLQQVLDVDRPVVEEVRTPVRSLRTWWRAAAAALVLLAAGGSVWFLNKGKDAPAPIVQAAPIEPGKEGAILTLADGSTVTLDSLGNGLVAAQAGSQAMLQNGQLSYESSGNANGQVAWNTITTPKARQFRLTLQDGTKVWLNAATVLRYPTAFNAGERKVELKGEAYFEVAKNASQPFRVVIGDSAAVEVLGTGFNINAYADEPSVRTTLLEGKVQVRRKQDVVLLQPGQQAVMQKKLVIDQDANIEGAMAWKNGMFNFEGASLEEFMRQISRWYDIEVEYKGRTPKLELRGKAGRDLQLQELLDGLSGFGIRYRLEGQKLIIQ